jgi:hypothetical protein
MRSGSLFGNRFEIVGKAGSGGMGAVYRARDRYTGDHVALKLLHSEPGTAADERFAREARLLAELSDPGIVGHVAHGQTPDGELFLAMEWLDGHDLGRQLLRGPLSLRDAIVLVRRVAEALAVAHQRGIIHRDIKPSNLFLLDGSVDRIKLLDFGIARRLVATAPLTRAGALVGTSEYMAPEQARGATDLTPAADIFSLGCVLYECLGGESPFKGDHLPAVLVRILCDEPAPIGARAPGVPEAISALISDMLRKDVAERIGDAATLVSRLDRLGELPELVRTPSAPAPASPRSSFAEDEQALFSLVMASDPRPETFLASTTLMDAIRALGALPERLADGTLMVSAPQTGSAKDQAETAARVALLIGERRPEALVALVTGRGSARGRGAVGEVADRAVFELDRRADGSVGGIWLDELSARLLGPRFAVVETIGGIQLLAEEKEVDRSRQLLGKPTPCVGRDAELRNLDAQLTSSIEESEARVVLITAPPGAGKSRLLHELLRRVGQRADSVTVLFGCGERMSAGAPYQILIGVLRRLCGLSGGEPMDEQRARLRERVARHLPPAHRERVTLFLGELCGVPFPGECDAMLLSAREDPRIMRDRLRRAFLDWLAAECAAAPVLLVLDDLQWGDALSVAWLNEALRELAGTPLLLLALGRHEVRETFPRLWHAHRVQDIPLRGLSRKACERLALEVLGHRLPAEAIGQLVEQSAGNALFLEELIRAAAEGKLGEQPTTVLAMLQARMGRLPVDLRRALLAASVFGPTTWAGGVARVLGLQPGAAPVEGWLGALVDEELIELHPDSRLAGESEHGFRHALVCEAAYGLLSEGDREIGHLLAGRFLEEAGERDAAVLAEHFERGGDPRRAAAHYARAAEGAADGFVLEPALRWAERGLALGAEGEVLGALRAVESLAALWLGQLDRVVPGAVAAADHTRLGSRAHCRALYAGCVGALFGAPEGYAHGASLQARLLATEIGPDTESMYAEAVAWIVATLSLRTPAAELLSAQDRLEEICVRALPRNPAVRRYLLYARSHVDRYQSPAPWRVLQDAREGARLCEEAGDIRTLICLVTFIIAPTLSELGDVAQAIELLRGHLELMQKAHELMVLAVARLTIARLNLAGAGAPATAPEDALPVLHEIRESLAGYPKISSQAYEVLARTHLELGQPAEALSNAESACAIFGDDLPTAHALHIRALLAEGRAAAAAEIAEGGLRIIQRYGSIGQTEVELRLAICEAFHAAGRTERARGELRETLRQVKIRADGISDATWRESYLTRNRHSVRAWELAEEWGVMVDRE